MTNYRLEKHSNHFKILFNAMASPCEILLSTDNENFTKKIATIAVSETRRVEEKYSRYRMNNLCWRLNNSHGKNVLIDSETFKLLEYSKNLFELSDGLFDITSGVLRKIWKFNEGAKPPSPEQIQKVLPQIGFENIIYSETSFSLPSGMEIDFGGVGKEYCVDSVALLISSYCKQAQISFLVNFGGDLSATSFSSNETIWNVGLESVEGSDNEQTIIEVSNGAVATSGGTKRFFIYEGEPYAHILNPKTGYPVEGAPSSVSVFAKTCSLAGGMSTLAQLQGGDADSFLKDSQVKYICCW